MKRILLSNITQYISSRTFILYCLLTASIFFISSIEELAILNQSVESLPYKYHIFFIHNALNTQSFIFFIPIISALPISACYIDDIKTNFIRYYIHRTSYRKYILGRIGGCFLCGGLTFLIGTVIAYLFSCTVFIPYENTSNINAPILDLHLLISQLTLFFFSCGFWALVGLAMSSFMESAYIAYASPLILFYFLTILNDRYFSHLFIINPQEWLIPSNKWIFGNVAVIIWVSELSLLVAIFFYINASRRLTQL